MTTKNNVICIYCQSPLGEELSRCQSCGAPSIAYQNAPSPKLKSSLSITTPPEGKSITHPQPDNLSASSSRSNQHLGVTWIAVIFVSVLLLIALNGTSTQSSKPESIDTEPSKTVVKTEIISESPSNGSQNHAQERQPWIAKPAQTKPTISISLDPPNSNTGTKDVKVTVYVKGLTDTKADILISGLREYHNLRPYRPTVHVDVHTKVWRDRKYAETQLFDVPVKNGELTFDFMIPALAQGTEETCVLVAVDFEYSYANAVNSIYIRNQHPGTIIIK